MRFKKLSIEDKQFIEVIHSNKTLSWDSRMNTLTSRFQVSERTVRKWIERLGLSKPSQDDTEYKKAKNKKLVKSKYYLISWAQNNTPLHESFYDNIKAYADYLGASVHIIAGRYRNPTSLFSSKNKKYIERWFLPKDDQHFLDASRQELNSYLSLVADVKVQPTAATPLSGFEGLTGRQSCIIGHPKVHLNSLPVLKGHPNKLLMTTGACTIENYTDTKAGKKGEFHHTFGFVIVEVKDDEKFFIRHVTADKSGNFYDLFYKVKDGKVSKNNKGILAAVLGDLHLHYLDTNTFKRKLDLYKKLHPKNIILHDIFDGHSINVHHEKNPIVKYHKTVKGENLASNELDFLYNFINHFCNFFPDSDVKVVRANHDDFLDRWVINTDWKKDLQNAKTYQELASILLDNPDIKGLIPYLLDGLNIPNLETWGIRDSFILHNWELAQHGDKGANGSRGSINQFSRQNTKMIVGHSHSPARRDGTVQVGTSTVLEMDYNIGPSSWLNSDAIIQPDGKVQQIHFIKGEYTTLNE